jgi:hypothetical protein
MEETLKFAQLQDIDCMIETFPLEKANEAYGTRFFEMLNPIPVTPEY